MSIISRNPDGLVEIVYYTDPLCCWSWGMDRHWKKLQDTYRQRLRWRYCMGGLLPDWKHFNDPVYTVNRPFQMGAVWMEASHLTGAEIDTRIWIKNPPSSSYLACIAVKAAGLQSSEAEEYYLSALRQAVMKDGKDISFASVLIDLGNQVAGFLPGHFNLDIFSDDLVNGKGLEAFRSDLQEVQQKGITRFPTFIVKSEFHPPLIMTGYRPYETLMDIMETMLGNKADATAGKPI